MRKDNDEGGNELSAPPVSAVCAAAMADPCRGGSAGPARG